MSHELEMKDGQASMFYAGEVPWHRLGTRVEREITAAAAIKVAGLDLDAALQPIYLSGSNTVDGIPVIGGEISEKKAVVREDGRILGVVGNGYHIIQNRECFDFMDAIIGEGQAVYHTAGSLFDGRRIFITVKLPNSMTIGPDKVDKYLLLSSSHDGSLANRVKFTPIRVVCSNTMSMALTSERGKKGAEEVYIKHSKQYASKINTARETLGLAAYYYEQIELCFNKLLDTKITDAGIQEFVEDLLPGTKDENGNYKATTRTQNIRDSIVSRACNGIGIASIRNTKWAAYNGVTEYIDHLKASNVRDGRKEEDVHFDSVIYGSGSVLRQRAYDLLSTKTY